MGDDLPIISLSSESTKIDLAPPKGAPPEASPSAKAPEGRPVAPTAPVHLSADKPGPNRPAPAPPAPRPAPPPAKPSPRPDVPGHSAPAESDLRKASDARKPGLVASPTPPRLAVAPSAHPPADRPEAAPSHDEDDAEKLIREYTERQKTKIVRLEQQLVELRKVGAERDGLKARVGDLDRELADANKKLDAAGKADEVIRDLQSKVDAALLSNSLLTEDKEKLKRGLAEQTANLRKAEERAAHAEKSLAEAQKSLVRESEGRKEAEAKVAAALQALHGGAGPKVLPATSDAGGRMGDRHAAVHAAAERPPAAEVPAGRPAPPPAAVKPPTVPIKK